MAIASSSRPARIKKHSARRTCQPSKKSNFFARPENALGQPHRLDPPSARCPHCRAYLWSEERATSKNVLQQNFNICCQNGSISLPFLEAMPSSLELLMASSNKDALSKRFREQIRSFNSMFAMTSHGAKIDYNTMLGRGPYTFRMHGQNYHAIGSLLPDRNAHPRYAQLYVYDTNDEIHNRYNSVLGRQPACLAEKDIDLQIISSIRAVLDEFNPYVKEFRKARDWFESNPSADFALRLVDSRIDVAGTYKRPTSSEVAALMIGDILEDRDTRDIIVSHRMKGLLRISELHPSYMPLQYPLLFPHGEDGWHASLRRNPSNSRTRRTKLTLREFYAFRLQQRPAEGTTLLQGGRLLQQYIADAYASVEEERLRWIRNHQGTLRAEIYRGLQDAWQKGDTNASRIGKKIVLPSSFTGGPRYMLQNYQDAMAICSWAGIPDLFITFTCNPRWPEFEDFLKLIPGQTIPDRPDLVARLFNIKCAQLLQLLIKDSLFGPVTADLHVIEFQKRGLPHTHILITLAHAHKLRSPKQIDDIICAEIPDKSSYPQLYELVTNHMIHGPCGPYNASLPCMKSGKCSKGYPKPYNEYTSISDKGFPLYRRRKDGPTTLVRNIIVDCSWVVPYNPALVSYFSSHINVEVCTHAKLIKYLFKYVHKGPDNATAYIRNHEIDRHDEISFYLDTRYASIYKSN